MVVSTSVMMVAKWRTLRGHEAEAVRLLMVGPTLDGKAPRRHAPLDLLLWFFSQSCALTSGLPSASQLLLSFQATNFHAAPRGPPTAQAVQAVHGYVLPTEAYASGRSP